jgi:hypothetical protein
MKYSCNIPEPNVIEICSANLEVEQINGLIYSILLYHFQFMSFVKRKRNLNLMHFIVQ